MTHLRERPDTDEPGSDPPRLTEAERVFCEYVRSTERLDTPGFEELCAARPELEAELRRIRFNWTRVSGLLEHLQGGPTFGERLRRRYGSDIDPGISLDGVSLDEISPDGISPDRRSAGPSEEGAGERAATPDSGAARLAATGSPATRRYDVRDEVARGGMGVIYKIWDKDLRRTLAMKVMLREAAAEGGAVDERILGRFLEEAQITGQLDHPGIVPVHDLGLDSRGRVYFTMRYVRGVELKQVLRHARTGAEGWTRFRVLEVLLRICEACAFAHTKGVVHRDLKPANVMVGRFGETYVMDWGLAKVLGRADHETRIRSARDLSVSIVRTDRGDESPDSPLVTLDGDVVGTPSYMSPEQAMGKLEEVGPRSDIYAVGCILYQLLTGETPYVKEGARVSPHTVLGRLLEGPPTPVHKLAPGAPAELVAVCEKAMRRDPEERYASMMDLAEDIRAFLEGRVVQAYDTGAVAEFRAWVARNKGMAATSAAAVVIAILGLASVILIQLSAHEEVLAVNESLNAANQELETAKATVEAAAAAERDSAEEARVQARLAAANEELARRRSYVNQLTSVDYSLRVNEFGEAERLLADCEERYRGWEWDHLALRADTSLLSVPLYPRRSGHAMFTRDGTRVLTGRGDSFFDYRDVESGDSLARIEPDQTLQAPSAELPGRTDPFWSAVSPDGRFAAAWARIPTSWFGEQNALPPVVAFWDLESGEPPSMHSLARVEVPDIDPGPSGGIPKLSDFTLGAIAVAPGDGRVALAVLDRVYVLDPETWEFRATVGGLMAGPTPRAVHVRTLAFSPDGKRLAIGLEDHTLRVADARDGASLAALSGHDDAITALDLHPSLPLLASASRDDTVRVWDLDAESLVATLVGHDADVIAVSFDPTSERHLVSGSADNTARVWDLESGAAVSTLRGHHGAVSSVGFAPDGARVVTASAGDHSVKVWDPEVTDPYTEMDVPASREAFLTEGTTAAVFTPDGARMYSGTSTGALWRWDARTGTPLARLEGPTTWITSLAMSPDGRMLAAGVGESVWLWDAETGAELGRLEGHDRRVTDLAFLPDGRLVSGSLDETVAVWDPRSGERLVVYSGHGQDVRGVAADPSGRRVASCGTRSELHVWDPATGELELAIAVDGDRRVDSRVNALAFHPGGDRLAGGLRSGDLVVWDAGTGEELMRRESEYDVVSRLTYHPDGSRVVTAHASGMLQIWGGVWGEPLLAFRAHARGIGALEFSRDGDRLLTSALGIAAAHDGAEDEPPRVWETAPSAARQPALRAARHIRDEVVPMVDALFDELFFVVDVKRRLATGGDLSPEERVMAMRFATLRGDDPAFLRSEALAHLRPAEGVEPDPELAVRLARRAVELVPGDHAVASTLGFAHYHAGEWERAIEVLDAAIAGAERLFAPGGRERDGLLLATTYRSVASHRLERGERGPDPEFLARACRALLTQGEEDDLRRFRHEHSADPLYLLAEDLAREAALAAPDDPSHRVTLGLILYRRGAYEESLATLEEAAAALREAGDQPEQIHLATSFLVLCNYRLGRIERGDEVATLLREGVERDLALSDKVRATVKDLRSLLSSSIPLPFAGNEE